MRSRRPPRTWLLEPLPLTWGLFLWGLSVLAGACAPDDAGQVPVPADLSEFDPGIARRIESAVELVRADPSDPESWGELAMLYHAERLRGLAQVAYAEASARDPDRPEWWYLASTVHRREGRLDQAIDAVERAIALAPDYAPAYWRHGTYLLEIGELAPARAAFDRCVDVDETFPGGWVGRARVHMQLDEGEEALELLERLRSLHPEDETIAALLATARRQAGLAPAGPVVETGTAAGARWPDPWVREMEARREKILSQEIGQLIASGRAAEAIPILEELRGEDEGSTATLVQLAESYFQVGRSEDAVAVYEELLSLEPGNASARLNLARIHEDGGKVDAALELVDQVLEMKPAFGRAHELEGGILYRAMRFEEAIPSLRAALEHDRRNPYVYLWLGYSLLEVRRWDEAKTALEAFHREEPDDPDGLMGLGKAHMKLGELDRAGTYLARAREVGGGDRALLKLIENSLAGMRRRAAQRAAREAQPEDADS